MSTRCFLNFPASEQKAATDSILYAVAKYVINKFPQRAIKQLFVDLQDNMRDIYKNAILSYNGSLPTSSTTEEMLKVPRPHMFVGYTFDSSFETTETGLGETQPYMHPNAFWFQNSMQSSHPILRDKLRNIYIASNNIRIRTTAEFVITCQSREEQFTMYNYILNSLKMYYIMPICGISASYILPSYMMTFLKDMLFGTDKPYEEVQEHLDEYVKKFSNGGIYPVYKNNKENDKFYELNYIYNRVDFKMTGKPQMDEGNKTNDAADNFTVRFPASVEFYVPTNYTISAPELIHNGIGNVFEMPAAIKLDEVEDDDLNYRIQTVIKTKIDDLQREPLLKESGYTLLNSTEFAITVPNDYFNIFDCVSNDELTRKVLINLTKEEIDKYVKIFVYEGSNMLDKDIYYTIDDNLNIQIKNGDVLKVHTLEIFIHANKLLELQNSK